MKKSEMLKMELENLKAADEAKVKEMVHYEGRKLEDHDANWSAYWNQYGRENSRKEEQLKRDISREKNREVEVGDGVTINLYSDSHAATVIKRTKTTLTVQQDTATLDPSFKPNYIPGGFAAHCTNQNEQKYTYESNPEGNVSKFYWSEKRGRWQGGGDGSIFLTLDRHEFYDYNF